MKRIASMITGIAALTLLVSGTALSSASAAPAPSPSSRVSVAGPASSPSVVGTNCTAWISGAYGHGRCSRVPGTGGWTMRIHVVCDAWWDANVTRDAYVVDGGTVELQGHCASSVDSVSAYWV
jgi:hypothetical protein